MRGWIIDLYPDLSRGKMVIWFRTNKGCYKIVDAYNPVFYVKALKGDYRELEDTYSKIGFDTCKVSKKTDIRDQREEDIMQVSPGKLFEPRAHSNALEFFGGTGRYEFYNVDIPLDLRYLVDNDILPMGQVVKDDGWKVLDDRESVHYATPPLRTVSLDIETYGDKHRRYGDRLRSVSIGDNLIEGDEVHILDGLNKVIEKEDPDVVITSGGDSFILPYLHHRGELNSVDLVLGREKTSCYPRKGKTYRSYGRVMYKPPTYRLKGRIHIDSSSSFMYDAGGLDGLIEISRLSAIPLQRLSRRSPGAAIDAMEMVQLMKNGYLIPWKKNFTEEFKSARHLILSDRGGYIFTPEPGIYGQVFKFDFASMYPSIIDRYNLSPETLGDQFEKAHKVPELGYNVSDEKRGVIPTVVAPLVRRRQYYKKISTGDDCFSDRANCLKWLLVTCFGYTGYKKARLGSIEVHESITAYGRDILLEAADIAQDMGFSVLHGIVDSLWLKGNERHTEEFIKRVRDKTGMELEREGIYPWLVFLGSKAEPSIGVSNRYFGKLDQNLEAKGVYMRRSDTPAFFKDIQGEILNILAKADRPEELREMVPDCLGVVKRSWKALKMGEVPYDELMFTKRIGKVGKKYKNMTETKAAVMQYEDMGRNISAGQKVRYLVTDIKNDDYQKKVAVDEDNISYSDSGYYIKYLYRTAGELLGPLGYQEGMLKKNIPLAKPCPEIRP